jgi:hypothetical protein
MNVDVENEVDYVANEVDDVAKIHCADAEMVRVERTEP